MLTDKFMRVQFTNTLIVGEYKFGSLASSYYRAFQNLELSPNRFCFVENKNLLHPFAQNRVLHRAFINSKSARGAWASHLNEQIIETAKSLGSRTVFFIGAIWILPETLLTLRELDIRTVMFNPDNPLPPNYNSRPETLESFREVDLYLIWSRSLAANLSSDGKTRAKFMPFAWDESLHPYMFSSSHMDETLLFVGGWDRDREIFFNIIAEKLPLKIFGPEYWGARTNKKSLARKCWQHRPLLGHDLANVTSRSAISISYLRSQHYIDGNPDAIIMRSFEVPGSGGFLLSTRSETAMEIFKEGYEAVYFSSVEEFIEKADYYLKKPKERFEIQLRAHEKTANCYRFEHNVVRIAEMLMEI